MNNPVAPGGTPQAILFDVGDTLVAFPVPSWEAVDRLSMRALHAALTAEWPGAGGRKVPAPEALLHVFDTVLRELQALARPRLEEVPARRCLAETLRRLGLPDGPAERLVQLERAWATPRLAIRRVFPDVPEVLTQLQARGIRLGLISNIWIDGELVRESLGAMGLLRPFRSIVLSSEEGLVKPHPALFARALEQLGVTDPGRAWYVGDNPAADVVGAHAAGMKAILLRRPPYVPSPAPPAAPEDDPDDADADAGRAVAMPAPDGLISSLWPLLDWTG